MSFLSNNNSEFLSARITKKGRQSIARGDFKISFFQIGDSEFDYTAPFDEFTGQNGKPHQKVFAPFDKEGGVKYPYRIESTTGTTTYGSPVDFSSTDTVRNVMGPGGFVTDYMDYDDVECTGSGVECPTQGIQISGITGSTSLNLLTGATFNDCEYITISFTEFIGSSAVITGTTSSLVYKVMSVTGDTLILDRELPDLSSCSGIAQVTCNDCENEYPIVVEYNPNCKPVEIDPSQQLNSWDLNVVWGTKPTGFDTNGLDESLSGFTSNKYVSTKQFLGYTTSSGQTFVNSTGGTISEPTSYRNSFDEVVEVTPEEQRCVAIIHYSDLGDVRNDPERFYKYDDYISTNDVEADALLEDELENPITDLDYFQVYIPFIQYHRGDQSTIGEVFTMDSTDYWVKSKINANQLLKYRYLLDVNEFRVGKVFVDNKTIVIDDQELVAVLDYKSNRKYTLPSPKLSLIPSDSSGTESFFSGSTAQSVWVSYMFNYTGDTQLNGLPCNYHTKIDIEEDDACLNTPSQLYFKLSGGTLPYMGSTDVCDNLTGFTANEFKILIQITDLGDYPEPESWIEVDYTEHINGHTVGTLIDPSLITNTSMVVTKTMYDNGTIFDIEDYLGSVPDEPSTLPQFGDDQPFPGSVKFVRASDIEKMNFIVNLPTSQFTTTQNPTHTDGQDKRITEVVLLNDNKEVMVIAKTSNPVKRTGTQVFGIKLDF